MFEYTTLCMENLKFLALHVQDVENSMPKLYEVTEGTKTNIYCQATVCQTCVLAPLRTIKVGLTEFGNKTKPLKYSEKCLNLLPIETTCSNVRPLILIHSRQEEVVIR